MTDPFAMRRRLTAELRRMRAASKTTQRQVAEKFAWSASKIIRIEQGAVGITPNDLRALLELYGQNDPDVFAELDLLARGSRQLPYSEYQGAVSDETLRYFKYEASASIVRQVALTTVPGLVQTDEYAKALFIGLGLDDSRAKKLLASRRERRASVLERADPPEIFFVIDEGALRRTVGGAAVMREQIDRLVELSRRPRVNIFVLPFNAGGHPAMGGGFNLLEFPQDDDPDVLFVENVLGDSLISDDPDKTSQYRIKFWDLEDRSVPSGGFADFVASKLETVP